MSARKEDLVWICSLDPGKKNFAFCIEEFNRRELLSIKNIPESKRYNPDGTPTEEMDNILQQIYSNGKIILHKNLDLTENCDPKQKLDPESFHNFIEKFDQYMDYWMKCSAFIIERQMQFKGKMNMMAVKLAQHCYSYFVFNFGRFKQVIDFPAYHKTQVLGAPKVEGKPYKSGKTRWKAMTKPQRKKWAVEKAVEILVNRGEADILDSITSAKKKDDLADTFLMCKAFQYLVYVNKHI